MTAALQRNVLPQDKQCYGCYSTETRTACKAQQFATRCRHCGPAAAAVQPADDALEEQQSAQLCHKQGEKLPVSYYRLLSDTVGRAGFGAGLMTTCWQLVSMNKR